MSFNFFSPDNSCYVAQDGLSLRSSCFSLLSIGSIVICLLFLFSSHWKKRSCRGKQCEVLSLSLAPKRKKRLKQIQQCISISKR